ncbi:hypothetical protein CRE_04456 [Caenorhabditis remanei]|uniref:Uncharacterized protein n=1 Tax=Caenorhabditis remanei TaxID=31234 RepID=E3NTD9_CAERE|nr:hypothetical protein CRE_04456 [Caenorhabditis remanei]
MDESSNPNRAEPLENASFQSSDSSKSKRPAERTISISPVTIPHRIVTSRGSELTRFRHHHSYRWIHQCEPRKPHYLKDSEGRSSSGQRAAKDTTSETEDARRIPIDSKGFDATIDRPAAASTLHPLPNQPISWHKGKILAENQTKETKIRFSRNEPKLYEQSTTGHCELMDKLMAPEAKTSQVPTPVTHDPRLHCSFHSNDSSRIQTPGTAPPLRRAHFTRSNIDPRLNRCPSSTDG